MINSPQPHCISLTRDEASRRHWRSRTPWRCSGVCCDSLGWWLRLPPARSLQYTPPDGAWLTEFGYRWNHWWFRDAPPHLLALFRILFGAFLLVYFGMQLPHVVLLYSREGLLMPLYTGEGLSALLFTPLLAFSNAVALPSAAAATLLFTVFLLTLLSFTIGFCTRISGAVVFLLYSYYWILSLFQFGTSFDRLFLFTLLVLACSGCGKTFSLDMRIRRGSFLAWEPVSILPQRLLAVQITVTYLGVGWQKLMLPAWLTGKVLAYAFVGRWATEPAWWLARQNIPLPVYDAAVWIIKAFELMIPFGLWHRRTRWWFMAGGAAFHLGIAVLMGIWWFLALIPGYLLFFEPEEGERVLGRGRNVLGGRETASKVGTF